MNAVLIGHDGINPTLQTRIFYVNREAGEATMKIQIDARTSVQVVLKNPKDDPFPENDWRLYVKVDGYSRPRSVRLHPRLREDGNYELVVTQVQMYYGMIIDV